MKQNLMSENEFLWTEYGKYCDGKINNELGRHLYNFEEWKYNVYLYETIDTYKTYISDKSKELRKSEQI